ncbi:ATP-binding protein [Pontibacterium granulatum]|uniref:ATP-binding protein n=1 Tax=Pontibacterium granulatum TaxID=2036029 RepID=UPI00249A6818|nr:ATP-binding protein [Pontibacterium granulatum]MDI3324612.1 ATP-binding protein [Pontibacterium granulatum]
MIALRSLRSKLFRSIQGRLLVASALVLPLVMLLAGIALKNAYHSSQEVAVNERLQLQVYLLLGSIELGEQLAVLPQSLQEPRYAQIGSGLYGVIHNANGKLLWRSPSSRLLPEDQLRYAPPLPSVFTPGASQFLHHADAGLYRYSFSVVWEQNGREQAMTFSVMESDQAVKKALAAYSTQLAMWLMAVLVIALVAQVLIMRWGIQPLKGLARDLKQIEQGEAESLTGRYPTEVQPVTDNLNRLIESERQQRERYRNTLGDLAHSLKTPLAVMRGAREEQQTLEQYGNVVDEQVARMDQIVQYQLSRAVKSQGRVLAQAVVVKPLVERMLTALDKVYRDKGVCSEAIVSADLGFAGDERDLMEVLGNLLENAYKYGDSQVAINATLKGDSLQIHIADDGPGVSPEARQIILERGARLDTSIQGQGIGLSVAVDIISSYDGQLEVAESDLGGALFKVTLPGGSVAMS